jgi:hypothetical protein
MTNIAQAVRILSRGKVTVGPEGTISSEDLDILLGMLQPEIDRMNPGFTGSELSRFSALFVLDSLSTQSGNIIEKQVNDTRWKVAPAKSSSQWMDKILLMIASFHSTTYSVIPTGVARCDSLMTGFDNTEITQYGDPSNGL